MGCSKICNAIKNFTGYYLSRVKIKKRGIFDKNDFLEQISLKTFTNSEKEKFSHIQKKNKIIILTPYCRDKSLLFELLLFFNDFMTLKKLSLFVF